MNSAPPNGSTPVKPLSALYPFAHASPPDRITLSCSLLPHTLPSKAQLKEPLLHQPTTSHPQQSWACFLAQVLFLHLDWTSLGSRDFILCCSASPCTLLFKQIPSFILADVAVTKAGKVPVLEEIKFSSKLLLVMVVTQVEEEFLIKVNSFPNRSASSINVERIDMYRRNLGIVCVCVVKYT